MLFYIFKMDNVMIVKNGMLYKGICLNKVNKLKYWLIEKLAEYNGELKANSDILWIVKKLKMRIFNGCRFYGWIQEMLLILLNDLLIIHLHF